MGELRIMDPGAGDIKVGWNPENEEEVKIAEKQFNEMLKKKFKCYRMFGDGQKGEEMTKFDKFAEKILFIPPMVGG